MKNISFASISYIYNIVILVGFFYLIKVQNLGLLIGKIIVNPKLFLNDIQENSIIKKLIDFKEFFILKEMHDKGIY